MRRSPAFPVSFSWRVRDSLLGRLPRLAELAGTAVYLASDGAGAISGAMVNLTCGAIID